MIEHLLTSCFLVLNGCGYLHVNYRGQVGLSLWNCGLSADRTFDNLSPGAEVDASGQLSLSVSVDTEFEYRNFAPATQAAVFLPISASATVATKF